MKLSRNTFENLTPQDFLKDEHGYVSVDLQDPEAYLSPFWHTELGIWVYEFRETQWRLYAIEMSNRDLGNVTPSERSKAEAYYGLDCPPDVITTSDDGVFQFSSYLGSLACDFHYRFFDGLLFSRIHEDNGDFRSISVSNVALARKDMQLPEAVSSLEDILITEDKLDGVGCLALFLAKLPNFENITRTGVFVPRGES